MMLLSHLTALPADQVPAEVFDVIVDREDFTPPPGLKAIGFTATFNDQGDLDETLIDIIIAYRLADIGTTLEVPAETRIESPLYLMQIAASAGFSLSLLPPASGAPEALRQAWVERLAEFSELYFNQSNFTGWLNPISSILAWLLAETVAPVDGLSPDDPYIRARFAEVVDEPLEAAAKAAVKARIHGLFGGPEGFANFARAMLHRVYQQTREIAVDITQKMRPPAGVPADGFAPMPADGTAPMPADGHSPMPADGHSPMPADGTAPGGGTQH